MNERIKELAEQAAKGEGWGMEVWQTTYSEKFAELIVRECADICKDTAEKQFNPLFSRESDGADVCYRKIKEHFGVEE